MYYYGGLYADLDMECLQPMGRLIDRFPDSDVLVGRMSKDESFEHSVPNAFMLSKPGHPVWLRAIRIVMSRLGHESNWAEYITGPLVLKDAIEEYSKCVTAVPDLAGRDGMITILPSCEYQNGLFFL